ncbi:hypothetical protein SLS58_007702 [Diplodia intermedia]|uniref:Heterokaryon incompatibility domain-containing protein n=1 Tax=Diplodia intermedia TaxID=856260 RepID=A0ABR3TK98_9PEZI
MLSNGEPNHVSQPDEEKDPWAAKVATANAQQSSRKRNPTKQEIKWICPICLNLGLSKDRFSINPTHGAERSQYYTNGLSTTFSPKLANRKHHLGSYEKIAKRRSQCNFCDLVMKSVGDAEGKGESRSEEQKRANCFVTWEIDGRSSGTDRKLVQARTRRLRLQWDNGLFEDAYLVLVSPDRHNPINSDERYMWHENFHFLARKVAPEASRATLIKSWLDECLKTHRTGCPHHPREKEAFEEIADQSYFGVIDVEQMCLATLPRKRSQENDYDRRGHYPYVALSYVWGGNNAQKTTHGNVLHRLRHGGLEESMKKMPKVIQDAVELVRRLGYRYLWIDALCIVQNSSRSWKLNAEVMNMIYGNADLTICAADGKDATTGLQALTEPTHSQIIVECVPGLRLMVSRLAEASIKKSKWNTRGWTFQERLLSRRCLIFTEGRVMFQCRSAAMSEDIVTASTSANSDSKWSLDLLQSPLKLLDFLDSRPMWFYMNCVQLYSARDLTKPEDILAAFNGVSNHIEDALSSVLTFGLPTSHFDLALLWVPLGRSRRRMGDGEAKGVRFDDEPAASRHKQHTSETSFPSWSWCGWQGCSMDYLTNGMIDDCLEDVSEWLIYHTWIQWHIRDGRGRLRPLWDAASARESKLSEQRWRGYYSDQEREFDRAQPAPRQSSFLDDVRSSSSRGGGNDVQYDMEEVKEVMVRRRTWQPASAEHHGEAERANRETYTTEPGTDHHDDMPPAEPANNNTFPPPGRIGDRYGRSIDPVRHPRAADAVEFHRTIPESPFQVNMTDYSPDTDREYPDSPILQFRTHSAILGLYPPGGGGGGGGGEERKDGLVRFSITDASDDWCGTILLSEAWVREQEEREAEGFSWDNAQYQFLALSDAKRFSDEECETWTYYLPVERKQSEWELYHVLLTEKANGTWSRVALGKVFQTAFDNGLGGRSEWEEIVLV